MNQNLIEKEFSEISSVSFEIIEGCLLRSGAWTHETLVAWLEELDRDLTGVEKVINHYHLYQLFWFDDNDENVTTGEVIQIGRKLKFAWETKLKDKFPNQEVVVSFDEKLPTNGSIKDLNVTAFIKRYA